MTLGGGPICSDAVSSDTPHLSVTTVIPQSDLSLGGLSLGGDVLGGGLPTIVPGEADLIRVAASATAGSVLAQDVAALTHRSATGALGTTVNATSPASLTHQAATSLAGTPTSAELRSLTRGAGTSRRGTASVTRSTALARVVGTSRLGTVTPTRPITHALATALAGSATVTRSTALTRAEATAAMGVLVESTQLALTRRLGLTHKGQLAASGAANPVVALTGQRSTSATGVVPAAVARLLTGLHATAAASVVGPPTTSRTLTAARGHSHVGELVAPPAPVDFVGTILTGTILICREVVADTYVVTMVAE